MLSGHFPFRHQSNLGLDPRLRCDDDDNDNDSNNNNDNNNNNNNNNDNNNNNNNNNNNDNNNNDNNNNNVIYHLMNNEYIFLYISGVERCVVSVSDTALITELKFLNPNICNQESGDCRPYGTRINVYLLACCNDGEISMVNCGPGANSQPVEICER